MNYHYIFIDGVVENMLLLDARTKPLPEAVWSKTIVSLEGLEICNLPEKKDRKVYFLMIYI